MTAVFGLGSLGRGVGTVFAGESAVRAIVVAVLPFLKLVVEEPDIVGDWSSRSR